MCHRPSTNLGSARWIHSFWWLGSIALNDFALFNKKTVEIFFKLLQNKLDNNEKITDHFQFFAVAVSMCSLGFEIYGLIFLFFTSFCKFIKSHNTCLKDPKNDNFEHHSRVLHTTTSILFFKKSFLKEHTYIHEWTNGKMN